MSFDVLAAIDLRGGKVVRLRQGDFAQEDVYSADPIEVGERFAAAGVPWLHVVDLDAARSGGSDHRDVIRTLLAGLGPRLAIEVAGGIRSERTARELLAAGASRVVMGTVALTDPQLVGRMVADHGAEAVAVAIDVRAGYAYGRAWTSDGVGPPVDEAIQSLVESGVRWFEVTAIDRDGSLEGPDLELLGEALHVAASASAGSSPAGVIASGGIRSMADLKAVMELGCRGAIVGRALYEGGIALEEAAALATRVSAG